MAAATCTSSVVPIPNGLAACLRFSAQPVGPPASTHHLTPQVWRKIWPKNISTKRCWKLGGVPRVHSGFYHAYTANGFNFQLMKRLKSLLIRLSKDNPGKRVRVYVTGHSLGGALATLCAYDVMTHCQMNHAEHYEVSCYTFGAPRTGNHAFAKLFAGVVPDTWHIINSDVRPLLLCGGRGPWGGGARKGSTPSPALPKTVRRGDRVCQTRGITGAALPTVHRLCSGPCSQPTPTGHGDALWQVLLPVQARGPPRDDQPAGGPAGAAAIRRAVCPSHAWK